MKAKTKTVLYRIQWFTIMTLLVIGMFQASTSAGKILFRITYLWIIGIMVFIFISASLEGRRKKINFKKE